MSSKASRVLFYIIYIFTITIINYLLSASLMLDTSFLFLSYFLLMAIKELPANIFCSCGYSRDILYQPYIDQYEINGIRKYS
jgi:hypothetical protein